MSSSFGDLIDLDALKNMVESNYRASGVPVGVIDAVSGEVYAGAGWQRICTEFHRKHPETNALCIESDTKIAGKIKKGGSLAYKCENGLWDIGIPVICDGIHIVTIFLGQFRYEDEILDKSLFQKRAQKYGFPTEAYMSALDEVPVFSREKVALILDYNQAFARFLSSQIDDKLRYKKEAEQRKKAESMHSDLFHNAAVGVVYQDNTGAIINANEASQKILGLSLPQMQGRKSIDPMWKTIYPDGSPFPGEEHPAMVALNTGKPVHDVVMGVYNPEDNQNHWLLINAIPQFHEKDSAPYQVFSTFNDITQRVLAEENLQNLNRDLENKVRMRTNQLSEKISELEALFNNSQVGIMALKGGRFLDRGNQRLADILGYDSPEEMTGISMQQLHLSEQRFHEFGEKYYNRLSQKEMLQIEYQLKKKDGTSVWCILSGKALDPETPTDLDKGVIWLVDDISTRKRAEKERKEVLKKLQNSEKDYKNLVDNSPEILYRFSEKAGGFFVSKRVEEILGYPVQYLMENPFVWNQSIHPEDQKKVENTIFQAKAGKSFDIEYRIKDKFGKWHWFQDRSIVITEGDDEFVIEGLAADITERKKNDMALLDVTRKLEMANKLGKSGWWEYDVEKDAVIWPRETYELYGLDPEMDQLEYSDLMQCILPEFHDYHNAQLERIYTEGECEFLYPIRHPDGEKRWIWAKGEADYNKAGEPVRLFGTLQDITERKKIEEKLQLQSQIISQVHDSVISVDLNGTITTWNKGSEALFQYTAQEIIGNHVSQVYPKAFHEKLENQIIPQLLSKGGLEYETKLVRKDGNEFHALISLSVLKNQRDEIYGMIGYTIDISNRKDAEQKLLESELKFRTLFNVAAIPLCYVDDKGTIVDFNAKFNQIFGYTKADIPTLDEWWVSAYPDPEYRKWVINTWEAAVEKARKENTDIESVEYRVTCKNGHVRNIIISGTALKNYFLATFIDITDRKKTEQELDRSNKELEQFAYVASHDLQEPLRAVVGFLQLLQSRYTDKLDEKGLHYIDRSVQAGYRMQKLINDLLKLSRVSTRGMKIESINLNHIIDQIKENVQLTIKERNVTIKYSDLPRINADKNQIESLFQNLIINGIKYNQSSVPVIEIGCKDLGDRNLLFVEDNGIGIASNFHERIFQVFQRLHTNQEYSGTGIGLALCKKIVERHKGVINVFSEPEKGARFEFTLPKKG